MCIHSDLMNWDLLRKKERKKERKKGRKKETSSNKCVFTLPIIGSSITSLFFCFMCQSGFSLSLIPISLSSQHFACLCVDLRLYLVLEQVHLRSQLPSLVLQFNQTEPVEGEGEGEGKRLRSLILSNVSGSKSSHVSNLSGASSVLEHKPR